MDESEGERELKRFVRMALVLCVLTVVGRMTHIAAMHGFAPLFCAILLIRTLHESGVSDRRNILTTVMVGGIGAYTHIGLLYAPALLWKGEQAGIHSVALLAIGLMIALSLRFELYQSSFSSEQQFRIGLIVAQFLLAARIGAASLDIVSTLSWPPADIARATAVVIGIHGKTRLKADGSLKAKKIQSAEIALLAVVAIPWEIVAVWAIA